MTSPYASIPVASAGELSLGPGSDVPAAFHQIHERCGAVASELLGLPVTPSEVEVDQSQTRVENGIEPISRAHADAAIQQAYECLRLHHRVLPAEARWLTAAVASGHGAAQPQRLFERYAVSRELVPARSAKDWTDLAKSRNPETEGKSAASAADVWHDVGGIPPRVRAALDGADDPALHTLECLLVLPEVETPLPPERHRGPSCTDALVISHSPVAAADGRRLVTVGVEAKVLEGFGDSIAKWLAADTAGTRFLRVANVFGLLGIPFGAEAEEIPWQLYHRTAAAVIEAARFCAAHAVMLVHSFDPNDHGKSSFDAFCALLGIDVGVGEVRLARRIGEIDLHLAWVRDEPRVRPASA